MVAGTEDLLDELTDKYSSWTKLKGVTAWILRFIACTRKRQKPMGKYLTLTELRDAKRVLIQKAQRKHFNNKNDPSQLRKLNPFLSNGLMVVGGRLRKGTHYAQTAKHPVILPSKSHLSTLLITFYHRSSGHCGVDQTLTELRKKYWITRGRALVKRVISGSKGGCTLCKRCNSRLQVQQMADLPPCRIEPSKRPFTNIGIDYFGPIPVAFRRSREKRYGCIFTCMATRAVHIEIAHTLNTDSFLGAFQRFIARRGKPSKVFSDNGTNLVSGSKELKQCIKQWNEDQISSHMLQREIEFAFNPPTASHYGGVWERMIRSTRSILQKMMREQIVKDECLLTVIAEAEKILNDRPLWSPSDDPDNAPLTPNQLILLEENSCIPLGLFERNNAHGRRWWKQANYLANIFWKRWISEYIPTLQQRQKWLKIRPNLKVGDIVLIADTTPRGQWPMGKIVKTYPDDCGLTRTVDVKTASSILKRPIHKLCLLESA